MSNGDKEIVPNLTIGEASQFEQIFKLSRIDEVVAEKKTLLPLHLIRNVICNECKSNAINEQAAKAAEEEKEKTETNQDETVNEEKIEKRDEEEIEKIDEEKVEKRDEEEIEKIDEEKIDKIDEEKIDKINEEKIEKIDEMKIENIDEAPDAKEDNIEQQLSINKSPELISKSSEDILERVKLEHKRNKQRQLYKRQQGKERLPSGFLQSESNSFIEWTPELEKNLGHNMRAMPRISRMVLPSFNQVAIDLSEPFQKLSEKYALSHKANIDNQGIDKELTVES